MINVDKNGWVKSPIVIKKQRSKIEHGPISAVNAIVLHLTHTASASSVLNAWKTQKEGAHFLISENGKIYQTASLKKKCWHVGKIHAKCRIFESCSDEDAKKINKILHKKNTSWGKNSRSLKNTN
jgi:N-acetyl-anhydromuramyl-L-alanine amidase AmpD